jgi:predicted dehydrogenase
MRAIEFPLRGAVIGCGYVSRFHLEAWSHVPHADIVALCDLSHERLTQAATQASRARCYTAASELFDKESLDFVEICTPPEPHRELVDLAARHGAHVLCQKPAALDRAEFVAMIEACDAVGVRLMIHENWRFRPWYRAFHTEIDAGRIGRPIRLRIAHHDTRALRVDGYLNQPYLAVMPRLIVMDVGCHLVDTARYLFGEIETVAATMGRFGRRNRGEDLAMLTVTFSGGAIGFLDMSWSTVPEDPARPEWALNPTVVEGTEGTLRLLRDGSLGWTSLDGRREHRAVPLPPDDQVYVEGYAATQRHFIDGLLADTEHETRASDNLRTMDVIWTAYRAAESGRRMPV